jgi:UDP-3-O-[3-hydroxymyristoyl] N-acetylglucosamine deacetylase
MVQTVRSGSLVQRTLKRSIHCTGIGLHSGTRVSLRIRPAGTDTGIRFLRTDLRGGGTEIAARWDHVVDTRLCTVVGNGHGVNVGTVEHLLAALCGCGVDNAVIEIDGPEVPVMDGSAAPFVFLIECAGLLEQPAPRRVIRVLRPVSVGDGKRRASLSPAQGTSFSFEIDFASAAVSHRFGEFTLANGTFKHELARARTFGFLHEVEGLRKLGLALGGSLDNAVVVSGDSILNEDGLRYEDEFVRHKILDSIGDLYLAGSPIIGHFHGWRSGHALNNQLLKTLLADPSAWTYDILREADLADEPESWEDAPRLAANA